MAALIRHGSLASAVKSTSAILAANTVTAHRVFARHGSSKVARKEVKGLYSSAKKSLTTRGFLRPLKSYEPLENTAERIDSICKSQNIPHNDDAKLDDLVLRFKLFVACEEEFKYSIPNSLLYTIENIGDLKRFYLTPVESTTPYEALRKIDLPKNLHVQQDYYRFHPDTDTMFKGKTAFPKSSTLVTGLKYKKKYPSHIQDYPWLDEQLKI
ncbi:hypothetical protein PUN28_008623 [Cardiocondyla obscurior]|uniref:Large ribosomal subunit protein mL50 n=1 Tax=Cardiocondyla obscurior TaxID=286306 RepID=A0AAW2FYF6_9HYME